MNLIKQTFSVKKMIVLLAALLLVMALAACGTKKNNDTKPANEVTPTGTDAKPETPAATATETPAPTATDTPAPTATETPTPAPTATEVPEPTPTPAEPGTPEYYLQAIIFRHTPRSMRPRLRHTRISTFRSFAQSSRGCRTRSSRC